MDGVKGAWLDQKGVEALSAAVIERAYIDYVLGMQKHLAWKLRKVNDVAYEWIERWAWKRVREKRLSQRVYERKGGVSRWSRCTDEEVYAYTLDEIKLYAQQGFEDAVKIRAFFESDRFRLFANRIEGVSLAPYADSQLSLWLDGRLQESQLFPQEPENRQKHLKDSYDRGKERLTRPRGGRIGKRGVSFE